MKTMTLLIFIPGIYHLSRDLKPNPIPLQPYQFLMVDSDKKPKDTR